MPHQSPSILQPRPSKKQRNSLPIFTSSQPNPGNIEHLPFSQALHEDSLKPRGTPVDIPPLWQVIMAWGRAESSSHLRHTCRREAQQGGPKSHSASGRIETSWHVTQHVRLVLKQLAFVPKRGELPPSPYILVYII